MKRIRQLASVVALMSSVMPAAMAANVQNGKALFAKCAACHAPDATSENVGPSLVGVFGRKAAEVPDFRYSAAMRKSEITWDQANLEEYIADPQKKVRGNRMPFPGLTSPTDVEDVIAYLKTMK
jgi:cytochrome c